MWDGYEIGRLDNLIFEQLVGNIKLDSIVESRAHESFTWKQKLCS